MPATNHEDTHRDTPVADSAALSRILREIRLVELLDAATAKAYRRYGANALIIDRSTGPDAADITAVLGGYGKVDLWDLDPLLWDEANWAAVRYVPVGDVTEIQHKDVA